MRFVSFDPFRTLRLRDVTYVKPEEFWEHRELLTRAACLLFPDYWQIHALVYGLRARIFPSLASYHLGHDKVEMTRAFRTICPEHVPQTLILPNTAESRQRVLDELPTPFVAKTVKSAQGRGVFLIQNREDWEAYADAHDVLYAQELLGARRDLRLVVIGDEVVGGYWREHAPGHFHNNVSRGGTVSEDPLPVAAIELVTSVARRLGIDHAGFDVMEHDGQLHLLEFNRLFGYSGLQQQKVELAPLIQRYLERLVGPERSLPDPPARKAS